jgi:hypothetical protein
MIWLKKTFPRHGAAWAADQDRFADLQMEIARDGTDAYRKMLMIAVRGEGDQRATEDIFLLLPSPLFAHVFPGYESADGAPARATALLVGDQIEFERQFPGHRTG